MSNLINIFSYFSTNTYAVGTPDKYFFHISPQIPMLWALLINIFSYFPTNTYAVGTPDKYFFIFLHIYLGCGHS